MFDDQAFQSWPIILVGAALFAGLFALLALLTEVIFEGAPEVTGSVVGFGGAAFLGYVGTAVLARRYPRSGG